MRKFSFQHKASKKFYYYRGRFLRLLMHSLLHFRLLFRWLIFSLLLGGVLGVIGTEFVNAIAWSTEFRAKHLWCYLLLPAGGVLIVWLYRVSRDKHDKGTNTVIASLRSEAQIPVQTAPLIFVSTIITHFCGGSAGREGAALQLGGGLGNTFASLLHMREKDKHILILSGMSAAFSAIFRTPVAAAIFAMEVGCVGTMQYAALVPCVVSSLTASYIAEKLGLPRERYEVYPVPELSPVTAFQTLILGIFCAAFSIIFCVILHRTEHYIKKFIKNPYLRILSASAILILMGLLFRSTDYYGTGGHIIEKAIHGEVIWYAFFVKMIFTAVTLSGGFKGGEIVPSFFVGATSGCLIGHIIGLSPSLCAAIGMIALFCGVTNCPLTSLFISAELFGQGCLPYCMLVIAVSYLLSGYYGLYKEQRFYYSKFTDEHIHHKTRE